MAQGKLSLMSSPRGYSVPSHILYADDILIFCKASKRNLGNLMTFFSRYSQASGQFISIVKSKFYPGSVPINESVRLGLYLALILDNCHLCT